MQDMPPRSLSSQILSSSFCTSSVAPVDHHPPPSCISPPAYIITGGFACSAPSLFDSLCYACCVLYLGLGYVTLRLSLCFWWFAKTPTKGLPPLQLVPLLGTLANCCSAHVFGKYPRRTPAKSTDTAFRGSSALTSLHYPFSAQRTVLSFKCGDAVLCAVLVDSYLRHLLSYF
ncbi:hypothetical protein PIB30_085695 [Stylosanthes scabra]|uniref:Uncharacterized protein n=1 Tax=Stylosanthes scabra TaxID=79078 RepID=A0ABU6RTE6_9FABA|nr:hypothetical protein [Stylosanthes scabra]